MDRRTKIVHDNRRMGTVAACVLARAYRRMGHKVDIDYNVEGVRTTDFWRNIDRYVVARDFPHVVLCGITFDESDPDNCHRVLQRLQTDTALEVWSHRWPDGYFNSPLTGGVLVPQYHLYTSWRARISDAELAIFRLAQVNYRDLPPVQVTDEERVAARGLDVEFERDGRATFERLLNEDAETLINELQRLGAEAEQQRLAAPPAIATIHSLKPILCFDLDSAAYGREEAHINRYAAQQGLTPHDIAVATRFFGDTTRIYLSRPLCTGAEPSIEWLLHNVADEKLVAAQGDARWYGPQDVRHLRASADLSERARYELRDAVVEFATRIINVREGNRTPPAGLARFIHELSTSALTSLDLLSKYTDATLEFDPTQARLLLDTGNRSDDPRVTLVLHLWVHSIEAAVFLFGNDAYNFGKLERLLEGAVLALRAGASSWMGSSDIPTRVRVDVHFADQVDPTHLPDALARPTTRSIQVSQAFSESLIKEGSKLGHALQALRIDRLVVLSDSELIGPSVPYAVFLVEFCRHLATLRLHEETAAQSTFQVLDVFAGSGVAARTLAYEIPNVHVLSVDLMISGRAVGIENVPNVTWLNVDARAAVGDRGIVDSNFVVAALDPPHALLFDLVFGKSTASHSLIESIANRSDWVVMYVGHATQLGRQRAIQALLLKHYRRVQWFRLGQEVVVVGGPDTYHGRRFTNLMDSVRHLAAGRLEETGWTIERLDEYRPKPSRAGTEGRGAPAGRADSNAF